MNKQGRLFSRVVDGFIEVFIWHGAVINGSKTEIIVAFFGGFVDVDLCASQWFLGQGQLMVCV